MAYEQSTYSKVTRSKAFKTIAGAAIGGLTFATVNYIMTGDKASIPKNLQFLDDGGITFEEAEEVSKEREIAFKMRSKLWKKNFRLVKD